MMRRMILLIILHLGCQAILAAPETWAVSDRNSSSSLTQGMTVVALRTLAFDDGQAVNALGYRTAGDGGGGVFRYESGKPPGTFHDDGGMTILPAGGDGGAAWQRLHTGETSVKWFGAIGDGIADDTPAINAAADYVRQTVKRGNGGRGVLLRFPEGTYRVRGSLNFTNIRGRAGIYWGIEGNNANILGECAGKPVFDFMRSLGGSMRGFNIEGSAAFKPRCAIQLARGSLTAKGKPESADNFTLEYIRAFGQFSLAALYNFGSERFLAYSCSFNNADASEDSYCLIIDGRNKFGAVSDYWKNELPVNKPVSCLNQQFIKCSFNKSPGSPGIGPAIYMTRTSRVKMIGCYAVSFTSAAVVMDGDPSGFEDIDLNLHCEPAGRLRHAIRFTSSYGSKAYTVSVFQWVENAVHAGTAAIYSDGPAITLNDAVIRVAGRHGQGPPAPLFLPGEKFKVAGIISCRPTDASLPAKLTLSGVYYPGGAIDSATLPRGTFVIEDSGSPDRRLKGEERWYGTSGGEFDGAAIGRQSVTAIADGSLFLGQAGGQPAVTFGNPVNEKPTIQLQAYDSASALRFRVSPDGGTTWTPSLAILSSGAVRLPGLAAIPSNQLQGGDMFYNTVEHRFQAYLDGQGAAWGELPVVHKGRASLDFPLTRAQSSADLTIPVPGAADGDEVVVGVPAAAVLPNSSYMGFVAEKDIVKVRFNNYSNEALDPAAWAFSVTVIK